MGNGVSFDLDKKTQAGLIRERQCWAAIALFLFVALAWREQQFIFYDMPVRIVVEISSAMHHQKGKPPVFFLQAITQTFLGYFDQSQVYVVASRSFLRLFTLVVLARAVFSTGVADTSIPKAIIQITTVTGFHFGQYIR